ncbi:MAG: alpha/beta fold hydrolase [Desulfuromonadia bacterium]
MEAFVNGIRIVFDDQGGGEPVILLHGFPLCRHLFRPQINSLVEAGFRVITPDLRGFGESDAPEAPYGMDLFADDLISLMDHLQIPRAIIGGMSMGGYILCNILARHPERVQAAIFLQTRPNADDEAGKQRRLDLARKARELGPQVVADTFIPLLFTDESLATRPNLVKEVANWMMSTSTNGLCGGLLAMRERPDYTERLAGFTLPSLVVGGGMDKLIPPSVTEGYAARLPKGRVIIVEGAGHLANIEAPNEVNQAILEFLGDLTGRRVTRSCC